MILYCVLIHYIKLNRKIVYLCVTIKLLIVRYLVYYIISCHIIPKYDKKERLGRLMSFGLVDVRVSLKLNILVNHDCV